MRTGSLPNAGTTARVGIIMYGSRGDSGFLQLRSADANAFCAGAVHAFHLNGLDDLGDIDLLRIGHDNSGSAPDWYVEQVAIECGGYAGSDARRWLCDCKSWFSSNYADRKTLRDLTPVLSTPNSAAPRDGKNKRDVPLQLPDLPT